MTHEDILVLLDSNDKAVNRAMLVLSQHQLFHSKHHSLGEYYATWVKEGNNLSGRFLKSARDMAKTYADELLAIVQYHEYKERIFQIKEREAILSVSKESYQEMIGG